MSDKNTGIEEYAITHDRFHPAVCDVLRPFFGPPFIPRVYSPENIEVNVVPPGSGAMVRKGGRPTAIFTTSYGAVCFAKGTLNRIGYVRGNWQDLADPNGWHALAHDAHHGYRLKTMGWFERIITAFQWALSRLPWVDPYKTVTVEIEAEVFAKKVIKWCQDNRDKIKVFEALRGANGDKVPHADFPGDMLGWQG